MQNNSKLEALRFDFINCQGSVEYYQYKLAWVQERLVAIIKKYKKLNKIYDDGKPKHKR
jgi:uncharacterized membrane protein